MTITVADYFRAYEGHEDITPAIEANAATLLAKVNPLLEECVGYGWNPTVNPATRSLISGQKDGGWRPPECPVGAAGSSHKQGRGVDIADADGSLDALLTDGILEHHGLYREAPGATATWCHLTDRAPPSKRRTFWP